MKELKYLQISRIIKAQISEGFWNPGDKIYSERQLAEIHDVSRLTIKRSLSELVSEGLLEYRSGKKGTFVASLTASQEKNESTRDNCFIGVAVDNHTPAFATHILQGIHEELWQNGYHTVYCNTYQENEHIVEQIQSLIDNTYIRGFILTPVLGPDADMYNKKIFEILESHNIPFVLVDRYLENRSDNRVVLNNREIFHSLAETLLELDHSRVLLLNGFQATSSNERAQGIFDTYSPVLSDTDQPFAHEIILDEKELYLNNSIPEEVYTEIQEKGPFTAIIGINQQLLDAGRRIMRELGQSPLTATIVTSPREKYSDISVVQPITRMGQEAAHLLLKMIEDKTLPVTQLILKAEILDNRED